MGVKEAVLVVRDGRVFRGEALGAVGETTGEVIFNTAMSGYQEILTDPSYRGQIVTMTYPLIGNYGGIDTRALTRHLRDHGSQDGIISSADLDVERLRQRVTALPQIVGQDLVKDVTVAEAYGWSEGEWTLERGYSTPPPARFKVVAYDAGIKLNILRQLSTAGCEVVVVPAGTPTAGVLEHKPDGVFLSNGPGDPEGVPYLIESVRALIGRVPIFGICLGHQILGLAAGGRTYKLPFGHHGANHPVRDLATGRIEITSQNHNFAVDPASVAGGGWEPTHLNLNDNTCEGLRHRELPVFCVQYHPEASPGPHDANYLFGRFTDLMASAAGAPKGS